MIKPSRYLEVFSKYIDEIKANVVLSGDILLVEKAEVEEIKTASGLIISSGKDHQVNSIEANLPEFVHVLATGEGFYNEATNDTLNVDSSPGDVLLVGKNSPVWFGSMGFHGYKPFTIGVVSESQAQLRFKGQEAVRRFIATLNQGTKG